MELWQWITSEDASLQSWFGPADVDELVVTRMEHPFYEKRIRIGSCVTASCLSFPLVLGVLPKETSDLTRQLSSFEKLSASEFWLFDISFQRDDGSCLNLIDEEAPVIKLLSILGDFASCLDEAVEQIGWHFLSFSKAQTPGTFALVLAKPDVQNLGDLFRVLLLLRAAIEILSFARGFKLEALKLNNVFPSPLIIDHTLMATLRNLFIR